MKIRKSIIGLSIFALILAGCGQKKTEPTGQSFSNASQTAIVSVSPSNSPNPKESPIDIKPAASETPDAVRPSLPPKPEKEVTAPAAVKDIKPTSLPSPKVSGHPDTAATPAGEPKQLDVGVKLDESGYKTMFRLYDASFEKIKE
ncbi:hypothetical protein AB4Z22_05220 [Paenibacillus sp. TAF58]